MKAVKKNNGAGMFSWIGSDGWAARSLVSDGMSVDWDKRERKGRTRDTRNVRQSVSFPLTSLRFSLSFSILVFNISTKPNP